MLAVTSVFVLILALYDTFEYACCYDDEKRKTMREWLLHRIQSEATDGNSTTTPIAGDRVRNSDSVTETTRLLDDEERPLSVEEIAMDTLCARSAPAPTANHITQLTDCDDVIIELERQQLQQQPLS